MDIQLQKSIIIEQFKQVNDIDILNAIQSILKFALVKKNNDFDIPEWHKDIVRERIENSNDDDYIDWEEAEKHFKK